MLKCSDQNCAPKAIHVAFRGRGGKLTVTHEIDKPQSKLTEAVSGGWPKILANLKSLIETGAVVSQSLRKSA